MPIDYLELIEATLVSPVLLPHDLSHLTKYFYEENH